MTRRGTALRDRPRRLALAASLALAAVGVFCAPAAAASRPGSATPHASVARAFLPAPGAFRAARGLSSDWDHACQVAGWLRYSRPPRRVVYVLGGSASREAVTSEAEWSRDLSRRLDGKPVAAYVTSSSCQTFIEDASIIRALPKGRGVAVIMVGLTRFYTVHVSATVSTSAVRTTPPRPWYQHHYDTRDPLPLSEKRALVANWRARHLIGFQTYYTRILGDLDGVIAVCLERGIRPVLVEMPANLAAIRHDFDDVRAVYQDGCRALAAQHHIAYLDFNDSLGLHAGDFYDLWHLLPEGRAKWQDELSRELIGKSLL
jgi:hypothetical protein